MRPERKREEARPRMDCRRAEKKGHMSVIVLVFYVTNDHKQTATRRHLHSSWAVGGDGHTASHGFVPPRGQERPLPCTGVIEFNRDEVSVIF